MARANETAWFAAPVVGGSVLGTADRPVRNPARREDVVGLACDADESAVHRAVSRAQLAQIEWDARGAQARADILEHAADLFEEHSAALLALCVREAGKTVPDAVSEVREAVDMLRYYAMCAREDFARPRRLP
jgi:RHH-type proline utilization regulon transcriptional repressor/proline dehydrogenase/delta 1-pyrroline-5-carboxylate dehydrogenase